MIERHKNENENNTENVFKTKRPMIKDDDDEDNEKVGLIRILCLALKFVLFFSS